MIITGFKKGIKQVRPSDGQGPVLTNYKPKL
jgi:hypothetical protein